MSFGLSLLEASAQLGAAGLQNGQSYEGLPNPVATNKAEWSALEQELTVSFANSNVRYAKEKVPQLSLQTDWRATTWKGEKIQTQLLVYTKKNIPWLTCQVSDLVAAKGNRIKAQEIKANFIGYVMTDEFRDGCGYRKLQDFDSSLVVDATDIIPAITVEENTVQPGWVSIRAPQDAVTGAIQRD